MKDRPEFRLDLFETAEDVPAVVSESLPDLLERPSAMIAEGEHRGILPADRIVARVTLEDLLPQLTRPEVGQINLLRVPIDHRHHSSRRAPTRARYQ
jgi:hypothetical protein